MSEITQDSDEPDEKSFLGAVHSSNSKQWLSTVSLNQTSTIDTGAKVTAITGDTYRKLQNVTLQ